MIGHPFASNFMKNKVRGQSALLAGAALMLPATPASAAPGEQETIQVTATRRA
jgi:hypothetical protein